MRMHKRYVFMLFAALILPAALLQAQAPQPDPKDPQYQAKGDQKRTYTFPGTAESIPYHLYVPMKWNKNTKLPLVIVTHGASQAADAPFQRGDGALGKIAEERGFVVAAITGYKPQATVVDGGYNNPFKMVPAPRPAAPAGAAAGQRPAGGGGRGPGGGGGGGRGPTTPATKEDFERAEMDILYVT